MIKCCLIAAVLLGLCVPAVRAETPVAPVRLDLSQFKLVWQDEFDGDKLDTTKWQAPHETRQGTSRWDPALITVKDGLLRLGIRKHNDPVIRYKAAGIRTQKDYDPSQNLFVQRYGYFEARCKLLRNNMADYWGAFWMMAGSINDNQSDTRKGVEIDIMETFTFAKEPEHFLTLHWNGYSKLHNFASIRCGRHPQLLDGQFHTFGLYWDEDVFVSFVDGVEVGRTRLIGLGHTDKGRVASAGVCQYPAYLLLSTEAAPWAGKSHEWEKNMPDEDEFVVDYVRVYTGRLTDGETALRK